LDGLPGIKPRCFEPCHSARFNQSQRCDDKPGCVLYCYDSFIALIQTFTMQLIGSRDTPSPNLRRSYFGAATRGKTLADEPQKQS